MEETIKQIKPAIPKSKYELTLAEFPLFLLAKGGRGKGESVDVIKYEDTIKGKDGEEIKREWRVYPDSKLGFGTASTFKTFFELFQIWKEQKFNSQYINFGSLYNLSKQRGVNPGKNFYQTLEKDLSCLIGIKIEAQNAFWDNEAKAYVNKIFHLFESLDLYKDKPNGQTILPLSAIKASDVLYGSVLKNSLLITSFDKKFFHSLTPVEQRLILYLSKIFRSQALHKRELLEFARQIPIYAKQTKHIKERLKRACNGLIKKKFDLLENFYFEKSADIKNELIVFKRKGIPPKEQFEMFDSLNSKSKTKSTKDTKTIDILVEDIMQVCEDKQSLNFYKKVARVMPEQTIYRVLGEVKETRDLGEVKKSKGALFTALIKKYATEQGLKL